MGSARIVGWFGNEVSAATNPPASVATTSSSTVAPSNGHKLVFRSRDFDQDTDEAIFIYFALPTNYSDGGTLNFQWLTTVTTGNVIWKTAYVVVHPSSESSPTDLDAAVTGTVTAQTAVAVPGTAGQVKQSAFDLGVTGAHAGDLLVVYLGRDADNASDNAAADVKLLEPWSLSFTTV